MTAWRRGVSAVAVDAPIDAAAMYEDDFEDGFEDDFA